MRCHYEVLRVSRDVNDDDLRKAYRGLALQLHPDKNPTNQEEAKEKFQEIQAAYEALSDPQERAFYDRNRDSILKGGDANEGPKTDDIDLHRYFNTSCFSGYNDSPKGFYTVFRGLFDLISSKDMAYIDDCNSLKIPSFGNSKSSHDEVGDFYGYWQSYCTSMSFCWLDTFDIKQAQNRWMEKRIEKENRKVRDVAKRDFNDEIRLLVNYIRKRDKRWKARKNMLEAKVKKNAEKQAKKREKDREERAQKIEEDIKEHSESLQEYEKQLKAMESQFDAEWGLDEDEESDLDDEEEELLSEDEALLQNLYCVACNKMFKNVKSFENHEQSRKHLDNVAVLKKEMQEEDDLLNTDDDLDPVTDEDLDKVTDEDLDPVTDEDLDPGTDEEIEKVKIELPPQSSSKKKKKKKNQNKKEKLEEIASPSDMKSKRKSKRQEAFEFNLSSNATEKTEKESQLPHCDIDNKASHDDDIKESEGKQSSHLSEISNDNVETENCRELDESQPCELGVHVFDDEVDETNKLTEGRNVASIEEDSEFHIVCPTADGLAGVTLAKSIVNGDMNCPPELQNKQSSMSKKTKVLKKNSQTKNTSKPDAAKKDAAKCSVCSQVFPSRSQLFSHIKAEGHAAIKTGKGSKR